MVGGTIALRWSDNPWVYCGLTRYRGAASLLLAFEEEERLSVEIQDGERNPARERVSLTGLERTGPL
jgi:hypothetical protein